MIDSDPERIWRDLWALARFHAGRALRGGEVTIVLDVAPGGRITSRSRVVPAPEYPSTAKSLDTREDQADIRTT